MLKSDVSRSVAIVLLIGLVGGVLWRFIADPARWTVADGQLTMSEQAASAQVGVTAWFTVIGIVVGLVAGWWVERRHHDLQWRAVFVCVAAVTAASLLAALAGHLVGPPDPSSVTGLKAGETVPQQLSVRGIAPYVMWSAAAAVGALLSVYLRSTDVPD